MKTLMAGLMAAALAISSATACPLPIRIACPNGNTAAGIKVEVWSLDVKVGEGVTDGLGLVEIEVPWMPQTYKVCVDESTLPAGATIKKPCVEVKVENPAPPVLVLPLGGTFCNTNPPAGQCWLTGGGTIGATKGKPNYSFGGVVYPGCSPKAADGGNLNVVDHANDMHFQGQKIIVDGCSGVSTRSPRVNVNIIDFHGEGVLKSASDLNSTTPIPVTFVGRAVDNLESGGGADLLYIEVKMGNVVVMKIGNSAVDPQIITTGNLQIHTTSCK